VYLVAPDHGAKGAETLSLGEALQRRAIDAERLRAEAETHVHRLHARIDELELEQVDLIRRESEARERMESLEAELRTRMVELEQQHDELEHAKLDIAVKDEQLAQLQAELAPLRATLLKLEGFVGYVRHRAGMAVSRRFPALHRTLKPAIRRVTDRSS
jgi:chromosome segregation ATPase